MHLSPAHRIETGAATGCPRCRFTVSFRPAADPEADAQLAPVVYCKHGPVELLAALEAAPRAEGEHADQAG